MCSVTDNQTGLKMQKTIKPPTPALCIAVWRMSFLAESREKPQLGTDAWFTSQPTEPAVTWSLTVIWSTFLSMQLRANRIAQQRCCSLLPFPDSPRLFPCYPQSCCTHSPHRDLWRGLNTSKLWQMYLIWSCLVLNIKAEGSISARNGQMSLISIKSRVYVLILTAGLTFTVVNRDQYTMTVKKDIGLMTSATLSLNWTIFLLP